MNYVYPVRRTLSSSGPVKKCRLTPEMKERRNFIAGHRVSIRFDENKNAVAEVTKK